MFKHIFKISFIQSAILLILLLGKTVYSQQYVFISDTQDFLLAEYLWNIRNNNTEMRDLLFEDILADSSSAVFHLGDLVGKGYDPMDWNTIDKFVDSLKSKNIPFYPVLGNHELILLPEKGKKNFQNRYPIHSQGGYLVRHDSLVVILLNSNFGHLSEDEINEQEDWLEDTLDDLDDDDSVKLVIVGTHYSPYTNSTRVGPDEKVQKYFVDEFMDSEKAKLFLSGHSHAFEHFRFEDKDFLVIGGGGGPQQKLLVGNDVRWKDHFDSENEYRRFHYIKVIKEINRYKVEVIMADSTYSYLEKSYAFDIKN